MSKKDEFKETHEQCVGMAETMVELLARVVLDENPELHEFIMAMGKWSLTDKSGNDVGIDFKSGKWVWAISDDEGYEWEEVPESVADLCEFIDEFDDSMELVKKSMRFTAQGDKITEW